MSISSQQIGWDQKSKLLYYISKQLEQLIGVTYNSGSSPNSLVNILNQNASAQTANLWISGLVSAAQLQSTIAIGTSPLIVASTTVVTNLNADLLDGQHGSYYQPVLGRDSINLTAGTTTTVTNAAAKTTSTIILSPTSSTAITVAPYVSTKSNGSFVITAVAASGAETLDYLIIN